MFIQTHALCSLTTRHCPHMGDSVPDAQTFTEKNAHSVRIDPAEWNAMEMSKCKFHLTRTFLSLSSNCVKILFLLLHDVTHREVEAVRSDDAEAPLVVRKIN